VFLEKLRIQGWLDLFTNTQLGCSALDLVEFYANCKVTNGVVTSEVNGKKLRFNAMKLGEILGVPAVGFDVYVRKDKSVLGTAQLLELAQKLGHKQGVNEVNGTSEVNGKKLRFDAMKLGETFRRSSCWLQCLCP